MPEFLREFLDITAPEIVEVKLREDGKVLWVNINGVCRLRISQMKEISVILEPEEKEFSYHNLKADPPKERR